MAKPEDQGRDALDSWEDIDNQLEDIGKGRGALGENLYEIDTNSANLTKDGPRVSGSGAYNGPSTSVNTGPSQERPYANSSPPPDIDDQILETLAHPRYRIKLLRLDKEIAKFVQSSFRSIEFGDLQELDGLPQFFRVLASKVGQLYKLNVEHREGLYYLEKTGETRIPQKSLADISVENIAVETESATQQVAKKQVLLKKTLSASNSSSDINGLEISEDQSSSSSTAESTGAQSGRSQLTSAKSVEKRLQDYEKARSRIFQKDEKADNDGEGRDQGAKVQSAASEAKARTNSPPKPQQGRKSKKQVAIFRNPVEERLDPDFQRNYCRNQNIRNYPAMPSTSPPLPPYPPQAHTHQYQYQYQIPTYDSEFPALGVASPSHMTHYPRPNNYGAYHGQAQHQHQHQHQRQQPKYNPSQAYHNANPYIDGAQNWQNAAPLYPPNHQAGAHNRAGGIQNQPRMHMNMNMNMQMNMNMYGGGACQTETGGSGAAAAGAGGAGGGGGGGGHQQAQWVGPTPLPYAPGPYSQNSVFSSGYIGAHRKQNDGSS